MIIPVSDRRALRSAVLFAIVLAAVPTSSLEALPVQNGCLVFLPFASLLLAGIALGSWAAWRRRGPSTMEP